MGNQKAQPRVTVIVLNWNNRQVTAQCLDSLRKMDYPCFEVIVVNNGSTDDSQEFLTSNYRWARILELKKNAGFVGGNNAALREVLKQPPDYVILINNDTVVNREFLSELVKAGEARPDVGMLCPKISYYHFPDRIWYGGGSVSLLRGSRHHGMRRKDTGKWDAQREVTFVSGCAFMVKGSVLAKIGILDEQIFSYCEDTDWSLKVQRLGYRGLYVPSAHMLHMEGTDWKKNSGTGIRLFYASRNLPFVFRRHFSRPRFALFFLYFVTVFVPVKSLQSLLRGQPGDALSRWKGVLAFLRMRDLTPCSR